MTTPRDEKAKAYVKKHYVHRYDLQEAEKDFKAGWNSALESCIQCACDACQIELNRMNLGEDENE
jgi:hypothetical protein